MRTQDWFQEVVEVADNNLSIMEWSGEEVIGKTRKYGETQRIHTIKASYSLFLYENHNRSSAVAILRLHDDNFKSSVASNELNANFRRNIQFMLHANGWLRQTYCSLDDNIDSLAKRPRTSYIPVHGLCCWYAVTTQRILESIIAAVYIRSWLECSNVYIRSWLECSTARYKWASLHTLCSM